MQFLKEELRVKILESSKKEFFDKGFSKASMRTIAKKSGITVGNIYRYFDGKNSLFDEVVENVYKELFGLLGDNTNQINTSSVEEFLEFRDNLIEELVKIVSKNRKVVLILLNGAQGTKYSDIKEEFYSLINRKMKRYFSENISIDVKKYEFMSEIISEGCIDGFITAIKKYDDQENLLYTMKMIFDYYFYDFENRFSNIKWIWEGQKMKNDVKDILYSEEVLNEKVSELGKKITDDYKGKNVLVIGVLKGANIFLGDLVRKIDLPVKIDFIAASSYGSSTESSGVVKILKDLDYSIEGEHVIIVEDIIDTGLTLHYLIENFKSRKPASLEICTLLDKPERRKVDIPVKYRGFKIPDEFIVGYGIDFNEMYRNLPYVATLKKVVYE